MFGPKRTEPVFLDTPRGLFTPAGVWFRTTVEQLNENYGDVLEKTPIDDLVHRAEVWLQSHRSFALLIVPFVLMLANPIIAIPVGLVAFSGWRLLAPSLGNRTLGGLFEWLGWAPVQILFYVIVLSKFGADNMYPALIAGLAWFVLIRWGLLDLLLRPLIRSIGSRMYPLPMSDQMLRAVIFSEAIRLGIPLEGFPSIARWLDDDDEART